ncbi:lipid IV(A) 3-deoxy-D-manno-octulosonic acid transferase [Alginatibacterium sediminis]|uniref:lipid IV(A) 3-deoxy-D-manno-octulosonic acid transferase n=1 Tax=Alginatibacterium sediminis TaxID=2164068 RepID=UPI001313E0AE|nr:lipid IV(A) 3-deoxy-D-manno-octulosonic acid transferase [Alginatibacterium sediminis]
MARLFYNLFSILLVIPMLVKLYKPKNDQPQFGLRWVEHFGFGSKGCFDIWVHAVSVGEVIGITPLIVELKQQQPELNILITTTTATGAEQVEKQLSALVEHRYAPLDFWPCVWLFFSRYQFKQYWIMETELWPNCLAFAKRRRVKVVLVNARMSQRSEKRYQKLKFTRSMVFSNLDLVLAQTEADAQRFESLGSTLVSTTGSLKFDLSDPKAWQTQAVKLQPSLFGERSIWVIASSHEAEEPQVHQLLMKVLKTEPNALCIWVPRHPERFSAVAQTLEQNKIRYCRRSQQQQPSFDTQVYLADTMGEMMLWYSMAEVAFIGGSLCLVGGHNYLEAAAVACPCVAGCSDFNFVLISQQLQAVSHLYLSDDLDSLCQKITDYLQDPVLVQRDGQAGLQIVQQNRGALHRTLEALTINSK